MSAEEVAQPVLRERQSRDRGWYEEMAACFTEDSVVKMSRFSGSGAGFVRATRDMADRGDLAVHHPGPPTVGIDQDRAPMELPLVIERRIDVDGVEADIASACRSQYRAQHGADGVWRIVRITMTWLHESRTPATTAGGREDRFV
ncbi:hypothetical protein F7R91_08750 [Streptomyces luteolifulvus]|uniref:SnoaL-like domain-containing protein n=1 Tax=Streptomyces luteolifulvus TaxID=2615112 RepID=A0A6H9V8S6_9ACTN|nr:nuclear transport factor 2 family protein [Streptomyces luteolifulvus]KAB1148833.1 hypothetical protein F7R91_08750 [Streptomyces luteolifulvus]